MRGESSSRNITAHPEKGIGSWTDAELAHLIRTGVARDGRYLPPWMVKLPNMSDEDLRDLIAFLRSDDPLVQARDVDDYDSKPSLLTKLLCRVAFKPFPWPERAVATPAQSDAVGLGATWRTTSCCASAATRPTSPRTTTSTPSARPARCPRALAGSGPPAGGWRLPGRAQRTPSKLNLALRDAAEKGWIASPWTSAFASRGVRDRG